MNKRFYKFVYFLLGISLSLSLYLGHNISSSVAQSVSTGVQQQSQARSLTQEGHEQLNRGQAANALETWQAAAKIYSKMHNKEGLTGSLINQSLALQSLGMYPRACKTLVRALQLEDWVCQNRFEQRVNLKPEETKDLLVRAIQKKVALPLTVSGLQNLGEVLRLLGKPEESETTLKQALIIAKNLKHRANNSILLSLANTERTLYNKFGSAKQVRMDGHGG